MFDEVRGLGKGVTSTVMAIMQGTAGTKRRKEAEDDEDRKRIKLHVTIRGRVEEQHAALSASTASDEKGALILSIDEVEEILDVLPPPRTLAYVRQRLGDLKLELQGA